MSDAIAGQPASARTGDSVRLTMWLLLIVYIFNFIDRQIVNILAEPIAKELPMEYALELNKLIELQMEGAVG